MAIAGPLTVLLVTCCVTSLHGDTLFWKPSAQDDKVNILQPLGPPSSIEDAQKPADSAHHPWPSSYGPFPEAAQPCNKTNCKVPKCRCSGTDIPGALQVSKVPQMVLLSFQTAVNDQNYKIYTDLFKGRKNPNGCPRVGTFFVSHNYTDYWEVQNLYAKRHEIGVNSVTSPRPPISSDDWKRQIAGQKAILSRWGKVAIDDIRGFRAPYLTPGGDDMIDAIYNAGMKYDSSRSTKKYMVSPNLMWPYSYDYASTQDCVVPTCPQEAHTGEWEFPLVAWKDKDGLVTAVPAACNVTSEKEAYTLLKDKFLSHYNSKNRAPLVIPLDTQWLVVDYKLSATHKFLDFIHKYKEAYTVTSWQALQWVQYPTPLSKLSSFSPWKCSSDPPSVCKKDKAITCQFDKDRKLIPKGGTGTPVWHLHTCLTTCPKCFPFLNDPYGQTC